MTGNMYLKSGIYSVIGLGMTAESLLRVPDRYLRDKTDTIADSFSAAILLSIPVVNVLTVATSHDYDGNCFLRGSEESLVYLVFKKCICDSIGLDGSEL